MVSSPHFERTRAKVLHAPMRPMRKYPFGLLVKPSAAMAGLVPRAGRAE